jgi:dATP pyrophosphohydrolase
MKKNMNKHKIIIEGFWGVGKTELSKSLSEKLGLVQIEEPNHIKSQVSDSIDNFYLNEHKENIKKISEKEGVVMERSVISSLAFLYAKKTEDIEHFFSEYTPVFKEIIKENTLVLFLYGDKDFIIECSKDVQDVTVKNLLADTEFVNQYENFYRVILPFMFGICPVCIKVNDESGNFIEQAQIITNVENVIKEDRIAQVNVVPFMRKDDGIKYLTLQRNERKGGFWQTITGGIHISGSLHDNVLREIEEELNLTSTQKQKLIKTGYSFYYVGGEGYELNEYVFGYELDSDQIVLSDEHVDFAFLDLNEAVERVKWDGNKEAIRQVDAFLNSIK